MASIVDESLSGIVYRAGEDIEVPRVDVLTLLFDRSQHSEDTLLHVSAANPSHAVTKRLGRTLTRRTAHFLRHHFHIGANGPSQDVVTILSTGHHFVPFLFYGVIAAGGVFSAASASSNAEELARLLQLSASKCLICNEATKDVAVAAASLAGISMDRVCVMSEGAEWKIRRFEHDANLITNDELDWARISDKQALDNSLIVLIFSSGTTGLPKAVCLSHTNLVAQAVLALEHLKKGMRKLQAEYEYRTIAHLPVAHIAGCQGYCVNPFYMGGAVYWMEKFSFPEFLEKNKKYQITNFFSVPPIYLLIAKSPLVEDHFDSLRHAISGAAPLGKELQIAASAKLGKGNTFITQTWGLSETTGSATIMGFGERDDTGSVSPLMPSTKARIVDEGGNDVKVGERGELWIKGDIVTKGYYNAPEANAETFQDGWLRTGDIGYFANGMIYCVDRMKELIKYKGLQVAPAELEALLLSHDLILDAAVIGVPTEDGTSESPRAYVVADQSKISEKEIKEYVASKVSNHKQLRGGVIFLDVIPKSPAGKILRKDLRALVKREAGSKL